jgi:integrase
MMNTTMFTLYRRHLKKCGNTKRTQTRCQCPVWVDGRIDGRRIVCSLDTTDWALAGRRLSEMEAELHSGRIHKPVQEAIDAFLTHAEVEPSTARKYSRICKFVAAFCVTNGVEFVGDISLEKLDHYKSSRKLSPLTWSKELQLLRSLFGFCLARKWCEVNPAREMKMPAEPKPRERVPYTGEEMADIIAACDAFGRHPYERLRTRAMVLLMRFYGLRISDVATLRRDRVSNGEIQVRAMKNGAQLWMPMYPVVAEALDRVPHPRTGPSEYFFWSGNGPADTYVRTVERTLKAMFRKSGVAKAHAHRFRHTLATEILVNGGGVEDVANILGDDPKTIREHYAKWSREYQDRTRMLLDKIHGSATYRLHGDLEADKTVEINGKDGGEGGGRKFTSPKLH